MGTGSPLGTHTVKYRGLEITLAIKHYALWMLGRVQDHYDQLAPQGRERADAILAQTGLTPLIGARTSMRIERRDFQEVFAI